MPQTRAQHTGHKLRCCIRDPSKSAEGRNAGHTPRPHERIRGYYTLYPPEEEATQPPKTPSTRAARREDGKAAAPEAPGTSQGNKSIRQRTPTR